MSSEPIDPFKAALAKVSKSVTVELDAADVRALEPTLTIAEAEALLRRHSFVIAVRMLGAGRSAIREILEDDGD